jgi:hypothetical protein
MLTQYVHPDGKVAFQVRTLSDGKVEHLDPQGRRLTSPIPSEDSEFIIARSVKNYGFIARKA